MKLRTVRLEVKDERALAAIRRRTGLSVSEVLRAGLALAERELGHSDARTPFQIYETLKLGPGGYARAPASQAKEHLRQVIARKHGRLR